MRLQWDVLTDKQACDVVYEKFRSLTPPGDGFSDLESGSLLASLAAEALLEASLNAGTMDNITVIVGLLKWE